MVQLTTGISQLQAYSLPHKNNSTGTHSGRLTGVWFAVLLLQCQSVQMYRLFFFLAHQAYSQTAGVSSTWLLSKDSKL